MSKSEVRESVIEAAVCKLVVANDGMALKMKSPNRAGMPDRMILLDGGRIAFVEFKTAHGKVEPQQLREHARLRNLGHHVAVIRSIEEGEAWFKAWANS